MRRYRTWLLLIASAGAVAVALRALSRDALPPWPHDLPSGERSARAAVGSGAPVRIIPIGDSVTEGGRVDRKEYTYRWPLARFLEDEGVCFEFIGSHSSGFDPQVRWPKPRDSVHEGYYGATTSQVRDMLLGSLPALPAPEIALVHLGTNDSPRAFGRDTVRAMRDIVHLLREANPRVVILIGQIKLEALRGAVVHLRLARLAAMETTVLSPVVTVNQYSNWNSDPASREADTFDGVHPNLRGQRKMAEAWLSAMRPYLPPASTGAC